MLRELKVKKAYDWTGKVFVEVLWSSGSLFAYEEDIFQLLLTLDRLDRVEPKPYEDALETSTD